MSIGIVVFPGSNCDRDVRWALEGCLGLPTRFLWHGQADLGDVDAVVIPGGFSYGDYLRCGAIARFAPLLAAVREMGLLPGALTRNARLHFICEPAPLLVHPGNCGWLGAYREGERIVLPIAHGEGRYQCEPDQLAALEANGQVVLRYANNPNGSVGDVAGITNAEGNVLGLMPHPERAADPSTGGLDGQRLLTSLRAWVS